MMVIHNWEKRMIGTFGAKKDASKDKKSSYILIFLVILTGQKENQVIITSGSETLPEVRVE